MLDRRLPERAAGQTHAAAIPVPDTAWRRAEIVLKWAAVLLGCSIPVSVALDNVLLGVLLFFWLAGGAYRDKLASIRDNPVAWMALALLGPVRRRVAVFDRHAGRTCSKRWGRRMRLLADPGAHLPAARTASGASAASRRSWRRCS